ncbi:MAG: hypothetical protein K0S76_499 [Herbinix sp.]|jgi:glyoxylase-like metal-dependent hydrolase (beta-lactamase superfamily II)|nr:hypothetical protein [Herbinix sp.]
MTFSIRLIRENTWIISGEGCDCYLLEGQKEAIMIDAGCSSENIRAYAQSFTTRPLKRVINTHSHYDHTGGNGFFEEVLCTEKISRSAKNTMGRNPDKYPLDYTFTIVEDGDVINLGGRELKIIELDCHSPGDIAVLDMTDRMLFTGDEIDSGQVLLLPGYAEQPGQIHAKAAASVETCLRTMRKLEALKPQFDAIYPSHNGSPISTSYIDWFITLCEGIISGEIVGRKDCSSRSYTTEATYYPYPSSGYLRGEYKGASLVYNSKLIKDQDYENAETLLPATPLHIIASYTSRR